MDALEDGTDSGVSETSGFRTQTPGEITPKENILHKEKGEKLKSSNLHKFSNL